MRDRKTVTVTLLIGILILGSALITIPSAIGLSGPPVTFNNPTPESGDIFGNSVSISGNNVLVGALNDDTGATDGSAYLFDATTGGLLKTFNNPAPDSGNVDQFGFSVSISGNNEHNLPNVDALKTS